MRTVGAPKSPRKRGLLLTYFLVNDSNRVERTTRFDCYLFLHQGMSP